MGAAEGVCLQAGDQEGSREVRGAEPRGQQWGHHSLPLEIRDAEEHLDHRVEVAAVPQVSDARVAGPKQGLQLHSRFLDQLPLANPLVHIYFQLGHRLVRLQGRDTSDGVRDLALDFLH